MSKNYILSFSNYVEILTLRNRVIKTLSSDFQNKVIWIEATTLNNMWFQFDKYYEKLTLAGGVFLKETCSSKC